MMDSNYRPQSPDLSSYAPRSPDLSGYPQDQDIPGFSNPPAYGNFTQQGSRLQGAFGNPAFGGAPFGFAPTSVPQQGQYPHPHFDQQQHGGMMPAPQQQQQQQQQQYMPQPDDGYLHDAAAAAAVGGPRTTRRTRNLRHDPAAAAFPPGNILPPQQQQIQQQFPPNMPGSGSGGGGAYLKSEPSDPTLGCQLKTSFPVARIKRIMQADEDIGKVAQVTPTVVSRALELFMIKLISTAALRARGGGGGGPMQQPGAAVGGPSAPKGGNGGGGGGSSGGGGGKRVLAQHLKQAVLADDTFDFLHEIVNKVPDAPSKAKKEYGSDSEDGGKTRRKARKRKDSVDD